MKKLFFIFGISALFIMGCGPSKDKRVIQIADIEKRLFSPEAYSFNKGSADSLVIMYVEFVKKYPEDTMSPGFLFKAANVTMNNGEPEKAIGFFEQYIAAYPTAPKAPMCLFFKAFVYENMLRDIDRAREIYLQFIEKYPKDDFVDDARMALVNLGKTPEMLIREFEERQRADSTRIADSLAQVKKKRR
jgi:outer membrane protein assembly factor BamD (BamD/ComL family)